MVNTQEVHGKGKILVNFFVCFCLRIMTFVLNKTLLHFFSSIYYFSLSEMVDKFGGRLSGSRNLENAIDYMLETLTAAGLDNVHTENASVPHWERGYENAEMVAPRKQNIKLTGLGGSVGTIRGGIIADVIAVESFDEFDKFTPDQVRGKIVLFVPKWEGYGKTVQYRSKAASVASKKGAVAALVRSVTPFSIGSVHTGHQSYDDGVQQIPVAAITVEDAYTLLRLYRRGETITIHLEMQDRNLGMFVSRNTIGEFAGKLEKPVVIVSGHFDSWDIGSGAMDDGGGAFISWKAVELLKKLKLPKPKRTIRAILWTGEEQGIWGSKAYEEQHKDGEENEFNFFIESDMGTFEPRGLDFSGNKQAECIFKEVLALMAPLNATEYNSPIDAGPDIERWSNRGFPSASLINKNERYFWFHHSAGDSMLVEDSVALDKNTALFAAAAYVIADLSVDMPKTIKS